MDGFNEKKWFIYLGDHHEGPFSLSEIQTKMSQAEVSASNYVWAEGMPDWKVMAEVPEFDPLLGISAAKPPLPESQPETASLAANVFELHAAVGPTAVSAAPITIAAASSSPMVPSEITAAATRAPAPAKPLVPPSRSILRSFIVAFVVAMLVLLGLRLGASSSPGLQAFNQTVSDALQPGLLKLTRSFPSLGKWISPIPSLKDVDQADYEELRRAAAADIKTEGAQIAIAVSTSDPTAPVFYVSGNLPEGGALDVYVEGAPDTLLNQISFSQKTRAALSQKIGQTAPVRLNGQALPRGQYTVYATESDQGQSADAQAALAALPPVSAQVPPNLPKGLKLLVSKSYFLGGPKDETYQSRLKEYHDKLLAKAQGELAEVKQFGSTLESQFVQTDQSFKQATAKRSKGKITAAARRNWNAFHASWSRLEAQLQTSWEKWTPEATQTDYFYGSLYRTVRAVGESLGKLHDLQHGFVEGKADVRAAEIQLPTLVSECQSALSTMKAKIDQAEKLTPTANGMPRREGL